MRCRDAALDEIWHCLPHVCSIRSGNHSQTSDGGTQGLIACLISQADQRAAAANERLAQAAHSGARQADVRAAHAAASALSVAAQVTQPDASTFC